MLVGYCDGDNALYWKDMRKDSHSEKLKKLVQAHLNELGSFGDVVDVKLKYWEEGIHYYRPTVRLINGEFTEREKLINQLINPSKRSFIVGEMLSLNQGWTEGALESVNRLFTNFESQLKYE